MCFRRDRNGELACPESHRRVAAYLDGLKRRKYSVQTLKTYAYALDELLSFLVVSGVERVQDVTAEEIAAYRLHLVERGLSPATQEILLRAARGLFNWMEPSGRLFLNPCRGLVVRRPPRKLLPVPSEADVKKLLAQPHVGTAVGLRDRALLEVAYCCGLRNEELVRLNVLDPDLRAARLRVMGKGRKERVVPLGKHAVYWLRQYLNGPREKLLGDDVDERALWINRFGERITSIGLRHLVRRYAVAAGLAGVTPHGLRRACATHMLRRGAHPVQIQLLLGHADMKSLSQYLRVSIKDLTEMHRKSKPGR